MKTAPSKKVSAFLMIAAVITILLSCQKTDTGTGNPPPPPETTVTASVAGKVTDLNNAPISNAAVTAGTSSATTDINGQFIIKNAQLSKDAGFVKITKAGYFTGSRTFLVDGSTTNNIKIQLIPKTLTGTIASSSGGDIAATGGAKINFTASSFVNAGNNTTYSGDVSVSAFYLNPTDANFREFMPGDLRGISTANKESILRSFGMLSVEMNDAGGQKIQLAAGKTATITIPIPSAMQAAAPASISLWYFDEAKGIWKEEGTATKQSTNYVGTVSHFSFWNAGEPGADIRLDAAFKNDSTGLALANKLVTITSTNFGTTNSYTDSAGKASGLVPANENLVMKVFNDCGGMIYTKNIGPFSTDTDLGIISFSFNNCYVANVTVNGTVINCSNSPVNNGHAQIIIGSSKMTVAINNGSFSITYSHFSNSTEPVNLTAYDLTTGDSSKPVPINVFEGTTDIGQLIACTSVTAAPVAGFVYSVSGSFVPATVTFSNTSTNATNYLWNFGDGNTSTLMNPVHIYSTAGDYKVTLTATGTSATDTTSKVLHLLSLVTDTYIYLTLNGTDYSWSPADQLSASRTDTGTLHATGIIGGNSNSRYIYGSIIHDNVSPGAIVPTGNYPFHLYTIINDTTYNSSSIILSPQTVVTEYGDVGGYITGTASGWIKTFPPAIDSFPFSCTYRVQRVQ